jgi:hypothetical protein
VVHIDQEDVFLVSEPEKGEADEGTRGEVEAGGGVLPDTQIDLLLA